MAHPVYLFECLSANAKCKEMMHNETCECNGTDAIFTDDDDDGKVIKTACPVFKIYYILNKEFMKIWKGTHNNVLTVEQLITAFNGLAGAMSIKA